jgi:hypothetical protein
MVACFPTHPVRYRCNTVRCYHQQREVVVEEGAAKDDEEEAYRQNLRYEMLEPAHCRFHMIERTKDRAMMVFMPAIAMVQDCAAFRRLCALML